MQPKQIKPNHLERTVEKENYKCWWLKNGYLVTFLLSAVCGVTAISALRFVMGDVRAKIVLAMYILHERPLFQENYISPKEYRKINKGDSHE